MATDTAPAETVPAAPAGKSKFMMIVGIIAVLIVAQAVITYFLMPKAAAPAPATADPAAPPPKTPAIADELPETAEVPLGDYNCTNSSNPGTSIHFNFKLVAIVTPDKASGIKPKLESHSARLRQTVAKIIRSAKLEDLNEPSFGTIRRLLREEINRLLRVDIDEIVITDPHLIEN